MVVRFGVRPLSTHHLLAALGAELAQASGYGKRLILKLNAACAASDGVAFPHARSELLHAPVAAFAHLAEPLDFGAADGRPCDLIYLLLSPAAEAAHLKALARAARFFRQEGVRQALRGAGSEAGLRAVLEGGWRRADAA